MLFVKWIQPLLLFVSGLTLLVIPYMLNKLADEEVFIQQYSPIISMPIVQRIKGWGTIKVPNKIYVCHRGKRYVIDCSNTIFRNTAGATTIAVHYDPVRDKIILPTIQIERHYLIQGIFVICGFLSLWSSVVLIRQHWRKEANG